MKLSGEALNILVHRVRGYSFHRASLQGASDLDEHTVTMLVVALRAQIDEDGVVYPADVVREAAYAFHKRLLGGPAYGQLVTRTQGLSSNPEQNSHRIDSILVGTDRANTYIEVRITTLDTPRGRQLARLLDPTSLGAPERITRQDCWVAYRSARRAVTDATVTALDIATFDVYCPNGDL